MGNTGTQNSDAFDDAMSRIPDRGARHWVLDAGTYHFARTLKFTRQVRLTGIGIDSSLGTHLIFPPAVGGLHFARYSDPAGTGVGSSAENLRITGGYVFAAQGGTAHGVEIETVAQLSNCLIENFDGDGIYIHAVAGDHDTPANANSWMVSRVIVGSCGVNGIHTYGSDANAGVAIGCIISGCPQGVLDDSDLGNFYFGVTCDGNTRGFKTLGVSGGAFNRSTFLGCYAEGGTLAVELGGNATWIGGTINEGLSAPSGTGLTMISGTVGGKGMSFQFTDRLGLATGKITIGSGNQATGATFSFLPAATTDDGIVNYRADEASNGGWDISANVARAWSLFGLGDGSLPSISFTGNDSIHKYWPMQLSPSRVVLDGGEFWLGPSRQASRQALPDSYTDHEQTFNVGDIVWNRGVAAGGKIGWVCTVNGTFGQYTDEDHRALGTYAEGKTATANGTTTVTLNGLSAVLKVGMVLSINGIDNNRILEKHTVGGVTTLLMTYAVTAGAGLAITFHAPTFKAWGAVDA